MLGEEKSATCQQRHGGEGEERAVPAESMSDTSAPSYPACLLLAARSHRWRLMTQFFLLHRLLKNPSAVSF
jgi:hypothetical protein